MKDTDSSTPESAASSNPEAGAGDAASSTPEAGPGDADSSNPEADPDDIGSDGVDVSLLHTPVLLDRCVELLGPALAEPGSVLVDATLGLGGHTEAFLDRFPGIEVIGLDRDTTALSLSEERLAGFRARVQLVHTVYDGLAGVLASRGVGEVQAVLFDLGVSSLQLDWAERGFSYSKPAPLDMRMDQSSALTAETVLAEYSEAELARIFREYGEERLAARYARRIVEARRSAPLRDSAELVGLIQAATPAAVQRAGHPAKRVFQALRIEVNAELVVLQNAIPQALDALCVGGRIVVMSYQSLEDRIVKRVFAARTSSSAPSGLPVELPEHRPEFRLLTRGAERASEAERARNPRATPVRLRAAERVRRTR